jgi:allantoicase
MTTDYIYLLHEREFVKTNEKVFKVGRTSKLNHVRFNQYPKGSVLLFQTICKNSKKMETLILKKFRKQFIPRKDIGNEYFEGDYKNMIDIIHFAVKDEPDEFYDIELNTSSISYENLQYLTRCDKIEEIPTLQTDCDLFKTPDFSEFYFIE